MRGTKVSLTIPFTFAEEGRYEVSIDRTNACIDISYVTNDEAVNKIMGIVAEGQRRLMPDDPEGMVNISKIIIKFPFGYSDAYLGTEPPEKFTQIKDLCVKYLNRLLEVIKYSTNRYWLRSLSPYHLNIYDLETHNDMGKGRRIQLQTPPSANFLPLAIIEYSEVESQISEMLMN
jgi:hypothetical protein